MCLWLKLFVQALTSTPVADIIKPVVFILFTPHLYWTGTDSYELRKSGLGNGWEKLFTCSVKMRKVINSTATWGQKLGERQAYSIYLFDDTVYLYIAACYIHKPFWRQMCSILPNVYDLKSNLWCTLKWRQQEKPVLHCLQGGNVVSHVRGFQQRMPASAQMNLRPPPDFVVFRYQLKTTIVNL